MITIKLFIFNKIMRLFYALFQLTHLSLFYRISEDYYYKGYMYWLDNYFVKQGIPTDDMLNDMAIDAETEHDAYMRTHYTFNMVVICPICGQRMMHRISQWAYVDITLDHTAVQDVITEEDGHVYSTVYLSRFCSTICVECATQGAGFDIEWYPCRDPRTRYLCNGEQCMNTLCVQSAGYYRGSMPCKGAMCSACSLTTCINRMLRAQ